MEQKAHILVVEDEQKIRTALTDFLEFHDFRVTEAADGLEAERIVDKSKFDLILLDLMLPKISGEQLCYKWRQNDLQTPIIMVYSARTRAPNARGFSPAGAGKGAEKQLQEGAESCT